MNGPVDIDDISPQWLTDVLGYRVRAVESQRVGTGQTAAAYRLTLDADKGPPTLLAKVAAGSREARQRVAGGFASEVGFYSQLLPDLDVRTPRCYYSAISEDRLCFTLLLEDLAPRVPGVQAAGCTIAQAKGAIRNLAGLHAPRWNDPGLRDFNFMANSLDPARGATWQKIGVPACAEFVERYRDQLQPAEVDTLLAACASLERWAVALQSPVAPLHGDYRLDNLMFGEDAEDVVALDWQTLTLGPPTRDLAYFLGTCLMVDERRQWERELVGLYHKELLARGIDDYDFDRCFRDYRIGHVQGPMITTIGCIYATAERSEAADGMFLAMARRSCAAIRDLGSLDLY